MNVIRDFKPFRVNKFVQISVDETPTFSLKHISKPLEAKAHITTSNLKGQLTHLLK